MAAPSIYRQLVLFDCDNGRLSLFKNHEKYLSQIPSNCECFIFWNDLEFPVYSKLKWILQKYSHIHLRPTYCEQVDDLCSYDLLFYLDELICKFSSVLIVHGDDQPYGKVSKHITEQYGTAQMEAKAINKPFSQHLPYIIRQLRKKNREYQHHEYLQSSSSKDQLKYNRWSSFSTSVWNYENNPIPYDFEENNSFKRIIKRKQKSQEIYLYNTRVYSTTQLAPESDLDDQYEQNDEYLSTICEESKSVGFEINFQQLFSLITQYRQGLKYTFAVTRKFDGKLIEFTSPNIIQPFKHFVYQKSMVQEKSLKITKKSVACKRQTKVTSTDARTFDLHKSRKTVKLENLQKVKVKHNSKSKWISCSHCIKIFRCVGDLKQHFSVKHVQSISTVTTDPTCSFNKKTATMQEEKTSSVINNSFYYSKLSGNIKAVIQSDTDSAAKRSGSVTSIYIQSSPRNNTPSTVVEKQAEIKEYATSSEKTVSSRRQCSEKLETNHRRSEHFIKNNSLSLLPIANISSNHPDDRTTPTGEQMNSSEVSTSHLNQSGSRWECQKKFGSHNDDMAHCIKKHGKATLLNDVNPPSIMKKPEAVVQKRIKTTDVTATSAKASLDCFQGSEQSQVVANCAKHSIVQQHQPILPTKNKPLRLSDNLTKVVQPQTECAESKSNPTNKSISCSQCTKKFKLIAHVKQHFDAKHIQSISSTKTNQPSIITDQTVLIQQKKKTAEHTTNLSHDLLSYSKCPEKLETATSRDAHSAANQVDSLLPTTILFPRPLISKTTALSNQTKNIKDLTNSARVTFQCLRCSKLFESITARDVHFNTKHAESNLASNTRLSSTLDSRSTMTEDQTETTVPITDPIKIFSCWKCSKNFRSTSGRISHLIDKHATAVRPNITELSALVSNHREAVKDQTRNEKTTNNTGEKFFGCWECVKKFKSDEDLINHFVDCHISFMLTTDTDPPITLHNHIMMAKERLAIVQKIAIPKVVSYNCSQCSKKFKSASARISHCRAKHAGPALCIGSKLSNPFSNQTASTQKQVKIVENASHPVDDTSSNGSECSKTSIRSADRSYDSNVEHIECTSSSNIMLSNDTESQSEVSQNLIKSTEIETDFINVSYDCQRCPTEFTSAADHLECSGMKYTEVKPFIPTAQNVFTDHGIMKCPKAKYPTLVYMSLGAMREQICIVPGKTNQCPHKVCKSRMVNYDFEELSSHITTEHKDAQLKLECCDPTTTYTPDEYKRHLLHCN